MNNEAVSWKFPVRLESCHCWDGSTFFGKVLVDVALRIVSAATSALTCMLHLVSGEGNDGTRGCVWGGVHCTQCILNGASDRRSSTDDAISRLWR